MRPDRHQARRFNISNGRLSRLVLRANLVTTTETFVDILGLCNTQAYAATTANNSFYK